MVAAKLLFLATSLLAGIAYGLDDNQSANPAHLNDLSKRARPGFVCTYKKKKKPGPAKCRYTGRLGKPAPIAPGDVTTGSAACRDSCLYDTRCKSYGFDASTSKCTKYKKDIGAMQPSRGNTMVTFSSRNCYIVSTFALKTPVTQAFDDDGLPSGYTTTGNVDQEAPGYRANKATPANLGLSIGGGNSSMSSLSIPFKACNGGTYAVSFYYYRRLPNFGPTANTFSATVLDSAGNEITSVVYKTPDNSGLDQFGHYAGLYYHAAFEYVTPADGTATSTNTIVFTVDGSNDSTPINYLIDNVLITGSR